MIDYGRVLWYLRRGEQWTVTGETYDSIIWHSDTPKPTEAEIIANEKAAQDAFYLGGIRNKRNALLAACDWTQAADAPVDAKAWAAYRQALRDLPAKIKNPTAAFEWPEPPK